MALMMARGTMGNQASTQVLRTSVSPFPSERFILFRVAVLNLVLKTLVFLKGGLFGEVT